MKLTPKDYVEAKPELSRAGFKAIKTLLANKDISDGGKTPEDIAILYGIEAKTVHLVATTGTYADLEMVAELEIEKEELRHDIDEVRNSKAIPQLTPFQLVWGGGLLLAIVAGFIWLVVWIVGQLT